MSKPCVLLSLVLKPQHFVAKISCDSSIMFFFLLDSECFKIKTKMNTTPYMTATLLQRSDSTKMTNSDESLHISSMTDTTSYSQYSINNGNKNGRTDSTSGNTYSTTYPQSVSNQDRFVIIT